MIKVYVVQIEGNIDYVAVCGTIESVVEEIMNVYNEYGVLGITREEIINQIKEREKVFYSFIFKAKKLMYFVSLLMKIITKLAA